MTSLSKSTLPESCITFYSQGDPDEVMRISAEGVQVNPKFTTDEATDAVIKALDIWVRGMVAKALEAEREAIYKAAEEAPARGDARETRQNILHAIRTRGNQ